METQLESSFKLTVILLLVFLIFILIFDVAIWYKMRRQVRSQNHDWIDKYYELKFRINLVLSLLTIGAIVSGLYGVPYFIEIQKKISDLQKDVSSLEVNLSEAKNRVLLAKEEVVEIESNVKALSVENRQLKKDLDKNVDVIFDKLNNEQKVRYLKEIYSNPDEIIKYGNILYAFNLDNEDFKKLKEAYYRLGNPIWGRREASEEFIYLFFRKFPEKIFNDSDLRNDFFRFGRNDSFVRNTTFDDFIKGWREFLLSCVKNGGISKNDEKIRIFHNTLGNTYNYELHGRGYSTEFYDMLFSILENKEMVFELYDVIIRSSLKVNLGILIIDRYSDGTKDPRKMDSNEIIETVETIRD